MISERYQVSASVMTLPKMKVSGYYVKVNGDHCILTVNGNDECEDYDLPIIIDPATIEPVRVKPIFAPNGCCPDALYCPNCNYDLMGGVEADTEHDPPYCWECGMALDWPKRSRSGWPDKED